MANVLILETNQDDMKFLKTLPQYSDENYFFTDNPAEALDRIDEDSIDIFVLPYEMEYFSCNDILGTANLTAERPLCIVSTHADDIKGLIHCLNTNSVFNVVIKPFQNILDLTESINRAVIKRKKFGLKSDDMILGLIGESKETAFWEHHDMNIDYRYLRLFVGIYLGNRLHDYLESIDMDSGEGDSTNPGFSVSMFIHDTCNSFMRSCALNNGDFRFFLKSMDYKYNSEGLAVNCDQDSYDLCQGNFKLMFTVIVFAEYCKYMYKDSASKIIIRAKDGVLYVMLKTLSKKNALDKESRDLLNRELSHILKTVTRNFAIEDKEATASIAAVI